jgi:hypothetical protein
VKQDGGKKRASENSTHEERKKRHQVETQTDVMRWPTNWLSSHGETTRINQPSRRKWTATKSCSPPFWRHLTKEVTKNVENEADSTHGKQQEDCLQAAHENTNTLNDSLVDNPIPPCCHLALAWPLANFKGLLLSNAHSHHSKQPSLALNLRCHPRKKLNPALNYLSLTCTMRLLTNRSCLK